MFEILLTEEEIKYLKELLNREEDVEFKKSSLENFSINTEVKLLHKLKGLGTKEDIDYEMRF